LQYRWMTIENLIIPALSAQILRHDPHVLQ